MNCFKQSKGAEEEKELTTFDLDKEQIQWVGKVAIELKKINY